MSTNIAIKFLGAAGTVTGSKFLISALNKNILIDCGMFQGLKKLRLLNWEELPVDIKNIDAVLLTHAHMDHTGYLPKLVSSGFSGQIYSTTPTLQITEIILKDSAKIQEEDAERANKEGYSKHKPAKPLYTLEDVEKTLNLFSSIEEGKWIDLYPGIKTRFNYNGHIVGASFIELDIEGKIMVFSGDIGRRDDILLYPPKKPQAADIILIESTYGNRLHPKDGKDKFIKSVNQTLSRNGTIIIPSFAVERSQALMYLIWQSQEQGLIPDVPVYIDSPMGRDVLEIFQNNPDWHKLSLADAIKMFKKFIRVSSMKETLRISDDKNSKIVISGSGMATGGRVLNYLKKYLGDSNSSILLVGYQAEGTRGRNLLNGAKELKIYGKYYPVRASVENIEGFSAHADQNELIEWLSELKKAPEKVFIVHGEPDASDALRLKIKDTYGWECDIPDFNSKYIVR